MLLEHRPIACQFGPALRAARNQKPGLRLALFGAAAGWLVLVVPASARAQQGLGTPPAAETTTHDPVVEPRSAASCLDANETSITLENAGKVLAARESLRTCAAPGCPTEIREECERRLIEINQVIPSVLFEFRDTKGIPVKPVQIRLDGEIRTVPASDAGIEADPGPHEFVFDAPGYASVRIQVVLGARQRRRIERISFSPLPPVPHEAVSTSHRGLHGQRLTALIMGGASIAAAGVGATLGIMAIHRDSEVDEACGEHVCADSADTRKSKTAVAEGKLSTAFFAVAVAAAGGGILLWLTAPEEQPRQGKVQVGLGLGTLRLRGTF